VSDLLSLPLHLLKQPLKIHSRVLGADIWLAPPNAVDRDFDAPVYSLDECRLLHALKPSAKEFRAVHLVKTLLHGDLIRSLSADHLSKLSASEISHSPFLVILSSFRLGICLCVEAYQEDAQAEQSF